MLMDRVLPVLASITEDSGDPSLVSAGRSGLEALGIVVGDMVHLMQSPARVQHARAAVTTSLMPSAHTLGNRHSALAAPLCSPLGP